MNDINSVILEGTKVHFDKTEIQPNGIFQIQSRKQLSKNETLSIYVIIVPDQENIDLVEKCMMLADGNQVRVIGHLSQDPSELYIVAEHIEIKWLQ